ncbi:reactive intermediate/imine deaminase [Halobacteriales archaeon QS_4_69_34]|nr:MAG: reactive intermediate/imine deaminase [Halobacteriales archaeon QS_4_69_34]
MKRAIETEEAPAAVGAYSQATTDGSLAFTAGQIPLTPDGESLADAPIEEQTRQCLENVAAVLKAADAELSEALKITVYLADIDEYGAMNEAYTDFFDDEPPARSALEAGSLPKGAGVEIEAIAATDADAADTGVAGTEGGAADE